MKRFLIIFSTLALFAGILSCDSSSDKTAPATTLTAKVKYTVSAGKAPTPGTGKIYLYLYKTAPTDATASADYDAATSVAASSGTEYTLNISNLDAGDYYAMVVYDYADNGSIIAGEYDSYEFYNGAANTTGANLISVVAGKDNQVSITFDDTWQLTTSGTFLTPTSGKVNVIVNYTGAIKTDATATGYIYMYLIEKTTIALTPPLPTDAGTYSVSTGVAADNVTSYDLSISNVPAGEYYVFIFYDYLKQTTREAGKTDKYVLYDSTDTTLHTVNCTANASTITISNGVIVKLPDITLADTYQLGPSDATFNTTCD